MTEHIPEWLMIRYSKLWLKFKDKEFTKEQAEKLLKGDNALAVVLSDLKKAGWLEMKLSESDARRTIYKLKDPKETFLEEINVLSKR
jgi:DNA-binding MarR family transcriptional regulator